jgi:hypothetical protein
MEPVVNTDAVTSGERKECIVVTKYLFCAAISILIAFSSTLVQSLSQDSRSKNIPHLYYFFSFRYPSTQTCENFLRSILFQLLFFCDDVSSPLKDLYLAHKGTMQPSMKELTACFVSVVNGLEEVRLFGDGFDECSQWNSLWYFLSKVTRDQCPSLRFIFASRPESYIRDAVNALNIPTIDLTLCDEMNSDIVKYISESLEDNPRFSKIPREGRELIYDTLIRRADGMYVYLEMIILFSCNGLGSGG